MTSPWSFPGGARFAFTVFDDTDDGTVQNLRPLYDLLHALGLRTTKSVWPFRHTGASNFFACETLENPAYLEWVLELQEKGFEITWHGASFESSRRGRTVSGLERFRTVFGGYPRIHANHAMNRENLYWGADRLDNRLLAGVLRSVSKTPPGHYMGHVPGSPWWWGDLAAEHLTYCRNLTFQTLNLARINPSMPYRDPRRPLIPLWFSASNAETVREFNALTEPDRVDRLAHEGGFSVVATHFGKGFVRDGAVNPVTRRNLEHLASRGGWFPTTGQLLDHLQARNADRSLPPGEWRRMQLKFAWDLARSRLEGRLPMGSKSQPQNKSA